MFFKLSRKDSQRGFTLLYAVLVGGLLLAIGLSIFNIFYKEVRLSSLTRDSDAAIYAADAGIECALYWEFQFDAFEVPRPELFPAPNCFGTLLSIREIDYGAGVFGRAFTLPMPNDGENGACALVEIIKDTTTAETVITSAGRSRGGASCVPDLRTVERTLEVDF